MLSLVGWHFLPIDSVGFGYYQSGDRIEVNASTHPAALVWAAVAICLYIALLKTRSRIRLVGHAGLIRRFLSNMIDGTIVIGGTSCVAAIIPLAIEAHRVGHFEWSFQRDYIVSTDSVVMVPLVLFSLMDLFFYFVYPLAKGKQTIGEYVTRVKVAPPFGDEGRFTWRGAMRRVFYSMAGLCLWPYTLWTRLDRDGKTWYDRASNCTVSLVEYKSNDANITS
jgi:hypothetical protein